MSSVKWIKLSLYLFENEKVIAMLTQPWGERTLLSYIRLLCLAGKLNEGGAFVMDNGCPCDLKTFAKAMGKSRRTVEQHLLRLLESGLLSKEGQVYFIPGWEKEQSEARLSEIREYERLRKQQQRSKIRGNKEEMSGKCPGTPLLENKEIKNIEIKNKEKENKEKEGNQLSIPSKGMKGLFSIPTQWEQTIAHYTATLPEEVRGETNRYLQTFVNNLAQNNRVLTGDALAILLEKLQPMAAASGLSLPVYLKEVICRGWKSFYPIAQTPEPPQKKKTSYNIEEIEQLIGGGPDE